MPSKIKTIPSRVPMLGSRVKSAPEAGSWRGKKTSTQRGYGYRWQKYRAAYLRQHPFCVMCQEQGNPVGLANVVDHKTPHKGPDDPLFWDPTNHQPLCKKHHDSDKQRQDADIRRLGGP